MPRQILINLPVKDIERSKQFFEKVSFTLNEILTDKNATCFNIEDNIILALLNADHFKDTINGNGVANAMTTNETLLAIGTNSKEEVDTLVDNAVVAGGKEPHEPADFDSIYARSFIDLDGHQWNVFYMKTA